MKEKKIVLDASAVLAFLNQESGHEIVEKYISNGIMSAVNFSEVLTVLNGIGMPEAEAESVVAALIKEIIPFDAKQAVLAASLRQSTRTQGLSLGDCACLSLAKLENKPALTADKAWKLIKSDVEILLIR